jgi:hypothetical protein
MIAERDQLMSNIKPRPYICWAIFK